MYFGSLFANSFYQIHVKCSKKENNYYIQSSKYDWCHVSTLNTHSTLNIIQMNKIFVIIYESAR